MINKIIAYTKLDDAKSVCIFNDLILLSFSHSLSCENTDLWYSLKHWVRPASELSRIFFSLKYPSGFWNQIRFEKNRNYIRYFSWRFGHLTYMTRWAIAPVMALLGDVVHLHNNLVHPSLAISVWMETKLNITTINLLNQFLPLNKIRLPKRNSRTLRPLIMKKQKHLL